MGCCGESANADKEMANRPAANTTPFVNQQPGPHPNARLSEKQGSNFYSAVPSPPPPSFQLNNGGGFTQNGIQKQNWDAPPMVNQFNPNGFPLHTPPTTPPSPSYNGSIFRANVGPPSPPLLHPLAVHPPRHGHSTSPSLPSFTTVSHIQARNDINPPSDEGKMSVSIDFGTTFSGVAYASSRIAAGKVQQ
ncbi:hypothetical protein SERLADRAFT_459054, partial [Serpula lacrymans var. lacrymans S7.9]